MYFGSVEVTSTQLTTMHPTDLVALLMNGGVKRITAERIVLMSSCITRLRPTAASAT
jgi:hypothetical protein